MRQRIWIIIGVYGIGFGIALIYYLINGFGLHRPYPYNTFLCLPEARFSDFTNMEAMCRTLDPYNTDPGSSYPPFANLIFYGFAQLPSGTALLIFLLVPTGTLLALCCRYCSSAKSASLGRMLSLLLILSYPTLFALDRGNLDLAVAPLVAAFLFLYPRGAGPIRDLACIALGFAIALKVYPLLFCLVFAWRRDLLSLVQTSAIAAIATFMAGASFPGGFIVSIDEFLGMLHQVRSLTEIELNFGYANTGLYYAVVLLLLKFKAAAALTVFRAFFGAGSILILLGTSLLLVGRRLEYWATATTIAALVCLVPALSNDYRLMMLLPCLLLFVVRPGRHAADRWVAVVFALLLVPKNYWILFPEMPPGHVGIASLLNPALEVILLLLAQRYRHPPRLVVPAT